MAQQMHMCLLPPAAANLTSYDIAGHGLEEDLPRSLLAKGDLKDPVLPAAQLGDASGPWNTAR